MKIKWLIAGIVLTCLVIGIATIFTHQNEQKSAFITQGSNEPFALNTIIPESPATAAMYKVISEDSISEGSPKSMEIKTSIPSESEAPALAEKALERYGGLPKDAVLYKVVQNTIKKYNTKTGVIEEEYPQCTQVIYRQYIDGKPVMGAGINVELGENGELLGIHKGWRTLEYAGEVPVITAGEAYEKLKKGETLVMYQSGTIGLKVSDIKMGYYAEPITKDQKYYTPVWLFYAAREGQTPFPYPVDAVKTT
ncbi:MAG: YycH protein [Methanoregula sp. PtaU1.Bin051]|nr:MAG: YycH protein [Methanoregula sp. PtaU1.Bin051]